MLKKIINASILTLALGAICFCSHPAFAGVKPDSHCLNGPNQGQACDGVTTWGCIGPDRYNGLYDYRSGSVQYLYGCADKNQADANAKLSCCSKSVYCYKFGTGKSCAQAQAALSFSPAFIYGDTCFNDADTATANCG